MKNPYQPGFENILETALREKLRFSTINGLLSTEQLFELPIAPVEERQPSLVEVQLQYLNLVRGKRLSFDDEHVKCLATVDIVISSRILETGFEKNEGINRILGESSLELLGCWQRTKAARS